MKYRIPFAVLIALCFLSVAVAQTPRYELIQSLTSTDPSISGQFGESVAVGDATDFWALFVGSPNLPGVGRVERFHYNGESWNTTRCYLLPPSNQNRSGFGEALSTSGIGASQVVVVGEPYFNAKGGFTDQGRVTVFKRNLGASCLSRVATLKPPVSAANQWFGASVDIVVGATESLIIVGAPTANNSGNGAAYIYRSTDGGLTWSLQTSLASNPATTATGFGWDVAIDGVDYAPTAVVGAMNEVETAVEVGAMYVYRRSGATTWAQDKRLTGASYNATQFGWSVDIAVSPTRTFLVGSAACVSCGSNFRVLTYERLETARTVTYQDDLPFTSTFPIGEDLSLKSQPGNPEIFHLAFTSTDEYYEVWTRNGLYDWSSATTTIPGSAGNRMALATSAGLPPHLAVGQPNLNKAWITSPNTTEFETVANGAFSKGFNEDATKPKRWSFSKITDDKRVCTNRTSCVYQFKGSAKENATITQVIRLTNHTFSATDTLILSAQVNTAYATPNLTLTLTVTENGIDSTRTVALTAPTSGWQTLTTVSYTLCATPSKLAVSINNKSKGGVIKVDNVSLMLAKGTPGSCVASPLPLPAAP